MTKVGRVGRGDGVSNAFEGAMWQQAAAEGTPVLMSSGGSNPSAPTSNLQNENLPDS